MRMCQMLYIGSSLRTLGLFVHLFLCNLIVSFLTGYNTCRPIDASSKLLEQQGMQNIRVESYDI